MTRYLSGSSKSHLLSRVENVLWQIDKLRDALNDCPPAPELYADPFDCQTDISIWRDEVRRMDEMEAAYERLSSWIDETPVDPMETIARGMVPPALTVRFGMRLGDPMEQVPFDEADFAS